MYLYGSSNEIFVEYPALNYPLQFSFVLRLWYEWMQPSGVPMCHPSIVIPGIIAEN